MLSVAFYWRVFACCIHTVNRSQHLHRMNSFILQKLETTDLSSADIVFARISCETTFCIVVLLVRYV